MLPFLCAVSLFAAQTAEQQAEAPAQQAAAKTAPPSLEAEVREALRRSALDGFKGTVSFHRQMWYPPTPTDAEGYSLQEWQITTDGNGQRRVQIHWPDAVPEPHTLTVVESHMRMWSPRGVELYVWDKESPPMGEDGSIKDDRARTTQWLMRQTVDSALSMLEWLVGAQADRVSIEILLLNRDPTEPSAVVKIGDEIRQVRFTRAMGTLLVHSTLRSDSNTSYSWTYSDYQLENGRWIARDVSFEQHSEGSEPMRNHYSLVNLRPAENTPEFQQSFWVPQPGEPAFKSVIGVQTFSKRFPQEPVAVETDSFPRLEALNSTER